MKSNESLDTLNQKRTGAKKKRTEKGDNYFSAESKIFHVVKEPSIKRDSITSF